MADSLRLLTPAHQVLTPCCKGICRQLSTVFLGVTCLAVVSLLVVCHTLGCYGSGWRLEPAPTVRETVSATNDLGATTVTPSWASPGKMLIYVCVEEYSCAGWSDRQRCIVSMFLLALVTGRRFGILLNTPCDVRNVYVPNKYDWVVNETDINSRNPRMIDLSHNLSSIDFNWQYPDDVLLARINGDWLPQIRSNPRFVPLLPDWAKGRYDQYFYNGWTILMKPAPRIQERLDQFLTSVNYYSPAQPPLVGLHVRMGKNPSNPLDTIRHFTNVSALNDVWRRVETFVRNGSQLFLASDSQQVRNISRQLFGSAHHDTDGVILHVGVQKHDVRACQGFQDAILDQLILSYCHVLFVSKGDFGRRASYMGIGRVKITYYYHVKD